MNETSLLAESPQPTVPGRSPRPPLYPPVERPPVPFDVKAVQALLDGEFAETRTMVKGLVSRIPYEDGLDVPALRAKVLDWTRRIAEAGIGRLVLPKSLGGEENLPKFIAAFETLAFHDL